MKFSEQIEILYKKSIYFNLSKLYKKLSSLSDEQLKSILQNKTFPDFKTFTNIIEGKRKHFTLTDGICILNCYNSGSQFHVDIFNLNVYEEEIELIFHANKYGISQLLKKLKNLDHDIINEILDHKPFPDFKVISKYLPDKSKTKWSIYEGVVLLKCFSKNVQYDYQYVHREEYRFKKSIKQSENLKNRDMKGLLGVTLTRYNKEKKKVRKIVRSVWTVKK